MVSLLACLLLLLLLLLTDVATLIDAIALAPVYWNSSNPVFKPSRNSHVIEVNLYDEIDFICPYYQAATNDSAFEYYIIYQVSKEAYGSCNLSLGNDDVTMIVNCSHPVHRRRFTMLFETFQAIPNAPEFQSGATYYYITTSTGHQDGLMNGALGACFHQNMKLAISVCCKTTRSTAETETTFWTPSVTSSTLSASSFKHFLTPTSSTSTSDGAVATSASSTSDFVFVRTSTSKTWPTTAVSHTSSSTTKPQNRLTVDRTSSADVTSASQHSSLSRIVCSRTKPWLIFQFISIHLLIFCSS